jgi:ankyrin repeat protein
MITIGNLMHAISGGDAGEVVRLLDLHPELAHQTAADGGRPLLAALYQRQPPMVEALLASRVEPDIFEAAAMDDAQRAARLLAAQPGLVHAFSPDGWTALHLAAHFNRPAALALLLEHGAPAIIPSRNALGNTPLHAALACSSLKCAQQLIEAGADVRIGDANGWQPLHIASDSGDLRLIEALLQAGAGADAAAAGPGWRTPIDLARAKGHRPAVDRLRQAVDRR